MFGRAELLISKPIAFSRSRLCQLDTTEMVNTGIFPVSSRGQRNGSRAPNPSGRDLAQWSAIPTVECLGRLQPRGVGHRGGRIAQYGHRRHTARAGTENGRANFAAEPRSEWGLPLAPTGIFSAVDAAIISQALSRDDTARCHFSAARRLIARPAYIGSIRFKPSSAFRRRRNRSSRPNSSRVPSTGRRRGRRLPAGWQIS